MPLRQRRQALLQGAIGQGLRMIGQIAGDLIGCRRQMALPADFKVFNRRAIAFAGIIPGGGTEIALNVAYGG